MKLDVGIAAQSLLNDALDEDRLDKGYVRTLLTLFLADLLIRRTDPLHLDLLGVQQHPQGVLW